MIFLRDITGSITEYTSEVILIVTPPRCQSSPRRCDSSVPPPESPFGSLRRSDSPRRSDLDHLGGEKREEKVKREKKIR